MKTSNLYIYIMIIFIIISCVFCSCVSIGLDLSNEKGDLYDVDEVVPIPSIDTSMTTHKIAYVTFGFNIIYNEGDIQQYSSPDPRLKYHFIVIAPTKPTVKLNFFSFTDANGDTIPSVLYYRTQNRVVNIIDTLPVIFTDEMVRKLDMSPLIIWAECSQSSKSIKRKLYVNYDIEVGDTHYVKSIKYTKKLAWDMRPKIW